MNINIAPVLAIAIDANTDTPIISIQINAIYPKISINALNGSELIEFLVRTIYNNLMHSATTNKNGINVMNAIAPAFPKVARTSIADISIHILIICSKISENSLNVSDFMFITSLVRMLHTSFMHSATTNKNGINVMNAIAPAFPKVAKGNKELNSIHIAITGFNALAKSVNTLVSILKPNEVIRLNKAKVGVKYIRKSIKHNAPNSPKRTKAI